MKAFAALYAELDGTTSTAAKVEALARHFGAVDAADAAWAAYVLAGGRPRQVVPTAQLRALVAQAAGLPEWLFEECYQAVGDLAETIAHVLPDGAADDTRGLAAWMDELIGWRALPEAERGQRIVAAWARLDAPGRFLLTKLIGGGFRVGVSRLLVQRAIARHAGIDAKWVAQRMMGYTDARRAPSAAGFLALCDAEPPAAASNPARDDGQPWPFFLAQPMDAVLDASDERGTLPEALAARLGPVADWQAEWKWDGIRAQLVRRGSGVWLWSRGEELVTERFPEVATLGQALPAGTVLDGELLVLRDGQPLPFALLQQRIGRKTLPRRLLAEAPVGFMAYDLLEQGGHDLRALPQRERRARLAALVAPLLDTLPGLALSPLVQADTWAGLAECRAQARARGVEGLMLKRADAAYGVGRTRSEGLWIKWKLDPLSVDAVLIYAQAGHGRRASVYTDYTFAVWSRPPRDAAEAAAVVEAMAARRPAEPGALQLVPFAKAYSGLSDAEFRAVDAVIRRTTLEKFGPVRSVRPTLVFELGFEGLAASSRHKSGIAVRFPRMLRPRPDKPLHEAGTLDDLRALLGASAAAATLA